MGADSIRGKEGEADHVHDVLRRHKTDIALNLNGEKQVLAHAQAKLRRKANAVKSRNRQGAKRVQRAPGASNSARASTEPAALA